MNNKRRPSRTVLFGDPTARRTCARLLVAIIALAAVAIALVLILAQADSKDSMATPPSDPVCVQATITTVRTVSYIPVSNQDFAALRSPEALANCQTLDVTEGSDAADDATDAIEATETEETTEATNPLADSCEADPPEYPQVLATSANAEVASPDTAIEEVSAYTKNTTYTENDVWALGKLITAEAGSWWLPDELQLLVGNVALNHVDNPEFPGVYTVIDAIYDPGVYEPVSNRDSWDTIVPTERALRNARRLLEGERFCPKTVIFQAAFVQGELYAAIEDPYGILDTTYFCYSNYYSSYS